MPCLRGNFGQHLRMQFKIWIKTVMIRSGLYYKVLIFAAAILIAKSVSAQSKTEWIDIFLPDTTEYVQFEVSNVIDYRYPPSNLFDTKLNTCWVSGSDKSPDISSIFLKLPKLNDIVINIFPGYGKSKELFFQNARPKEIKLNIFAAINPDGYVSEYGAIYKVVQFHREQNIHLADSFCVQSVHLDFFPEKLADFQKSIHKSYDIEFETPGAETCLILRIEIMETYPGTKYDDVCISEIFFNDRFVSPHLQTANLIEKVYLNAAENALLLDYSIHRGEVVYRDTLSVLQIIEISDNKKWAIIISMPAEIEGRAETSYLLFNLLNKKMLNSQLERYTGSYFPGNAMYFESDESGRIYLTYLAKDGEYNKIVLR